MIEPGKNTGVIILPPSRERSRGIPPLFDTASDWRAYESRGEWQKDMAVEFETNACMSFAANDCLETYLNWLIATGKILPAQHDFLKNKGYIDQNSNVNFSDRFTAYMSGTTVNGNDFESVWKWIENGGLVPESEWPFPLTEINASPKNAWSIYYQAPPASLVALGKEFLQYFDIDWQWLVSNGRGASDALFQAWLQTAPIHLAVAVCPPWNTAQQINGCGPGAQHGVQLSFIDKSGVAHILDHYDPFDKLFAANYTLSYAVQGWVNQLPQAPAPAPTPDPVVENLKQQISLYQKIVQLLQNWLSTHRPKAGLAGAIMTGMNTTITGYVIAFGEIIFALVGLVTGWISAAEATTILVLGLSTFGIHKQNVAIAAAARGY
jgi:hypothetical protein